MQWSQVYLKLNILVAASTSQFNLRPLYLDTQYTTAIDLFEQQLSESQMIHLPLSVENQQIENTFLSKGVRATEDFYFCCDVG